MAGGITRVLPKSIGGLWSKDDLGEIGMVKTSEPNAQNGTLMFKIKAAVSDGEGWRGESEEQRGRKRNQRL